MATSSGARRVGRLALLSTAALISLAAPTTRWSEPARRAEKAGRRERAYRLVAGAFGSPLRRRSRVSYVSLPRRRLPTAMLALGALLILAAIPTHAADPWKPRGRDAPDRERYEPKPVGFKDKQGPVEVEPPGVASV